MFPLVHHHHQRLASVPKNLFFYYRFVPVTADYDAQNPWEERTCTSSCLDRRIVVVATALFRYAAVILTSPTGPPRLDRTVAARDGQFPAFQGLGTSSEWFV